MDKPPVNPVNSEVNVEVNMEVWVDAMAALIGLPLLPEHRSGVIENFERIRAIAQPVMAFPLPEDIEAGPTFEP